jgi:hypothetical protein
MPDSAPSQTIYVPQPNNQLCQSACIAMALGTIDVEGIRADLLDLGVAGDPAVMASYIKPRVRDYKLDLSGSLFEAKAAIDDGYIVIIHGWFTRPGHVVVLIGHEADPDTLSYRFIVHDPFAEYDFPNGDHDESRSGEGVRYSSFGMYATCVGSPDYEGARDLYRRKKLNSEEKNAWLHIIKR